MLKFLTAEQVSCRSVSPDKAIYLSPVYYKVIFKKLVLPDDTMPLPTKTFLRKDVGGICSLEEVALLFHFQQ